MINRIIRKIKFFVGQKPKNISGHLNWSFSDPEGFLNYLQKQPVRSFVFNLLKNENKKESYSDLLEIGFGAADQYKAIGSTLKELGINYQGMDYTDNFVKNAKAKYPEASWTQGDVRDINLKTNSKDVIFIYHVLEHQSGYEDVKKAIIEMCRVARRKVVIIWFKRPTFAHDTEGGKQEDGFWYWKYSVADIWKATNEGGYNVEKITSGQNMVWEITNPDFMEKHPEDRKKTFLSRLEADYKNKKIKKLTFISDTSEFKTKEITSFCSSNNIEIIETELDSINDDNKTDWLICSFSNKNKKSEVDDFLEKIITATDRRILISWDKEISIKEKGSLIDQIPGEYEFSGAEVWKKILDLGFEIKQLSFGKNPIWEIEKQQYSDFIIKNKLF